MDKISEHIIHQRRWNITPHLLSMGDAWWLPSKDCVWNDRGGDSAVEKPDRHYFVPTIKVNSSSHRVYPWDNVMRRALFLCDLPLHSSQPQSKHERNMRQIQIERQFAKYMTNGPHNCQGHQKEESEKMS